MIIMIMMIVVKNEQEQPQMSWHDGHSLSHPMSHRPSAAIVSCRIESSCRRRMSCSKAVDRLILSFLRSHLVALLLLLALLLADPAASFGSRSATAPPSLLRRTPARALSVRFLRQQRILPASVVSDLESMPKPMSTVSSAATGSIATKTVDRRAERGEKNDDQEEAVPATLREAFDTFLLGSHNGPRLAIAAIAGFSVWRLQLGPVETVDGLVFAALVVFWWLQEHVLHKHALHSRWDWPGKEIHREHHAKPYAHLALSATLGYATAGLFYEWAHYVVHTKVPFPRGSYWYRMKHHHIRHHMVDSKYWLGFSVPAVDDFFGTNPTLHQWKKNQQQQQQRDSDE